MQTTLLYRFCFRGIISAWGRVIGASLSEPHINGTAMRAIYGICIYVYMYICIYICMVRPSSARRFIDFVRRGQGRPHAIFCADQRHPPAALGPHAIFCTEKSALKENCDLSMQCIFVKDSRHTFRIYAYSNLANCKFTLVQYTVLQCQSARHKRNQASAGK